ncbi:MAG: polysaccharide deacetylase family protein, partial [Flavobacteriales bacterium]
YRNSIPFPDLDESGRFDPFASSFFLLARVEEYAASEFDEHGRFSGRQAWGGEQLLTWPWADVWRKEVQEAVSAAYPNFHCNVPAFRTVATIDVDSAFAYRYKGVRRTLGAAALDVFRLNFGNAVKRLKCVLSNDKDPFDTYEYVLETALSQHVELRCFFLLADRSRYDINMDYRNAQLRERIEDMFDGATIVGIHPGYQSHNDLRLLAKEIGRLQSIVGERILHSRQHFLKFRLPVSYRRLLECGITNDHSMGYADVPGFRAGTAHPFKWFDVDRNEPTSLAVHPVIVMDSTLRTYNGLNPTQALEKIAQLKSAMRNTGGDFVSLWHNETVAEQGDWVGWRAVWEEAVKH